MAVKAGDVLLAIKAETSDFKKGMTQAVSSVKSQFSSMTKLVAGAFAGKAVKDFTADCLELGSDLTEVQNVVDTTFGGMSSQVKNFASNAMQSYGLSTKMAEQYTGTFGAMSKAMGFSMKQSAAMSQTLTGLSGDLASFYNLSQDDTAKKLQSVFTGETEPLRQLGISLTDTTLQQYLYKQGINESISAMTQQEKAILRYQYVLDNTKDAQGDFAKTSASWANQTRILKLQVDQLKTTLGQGFISALTPAINVLNELISRLTAAVSAMGLFSKSTKAQSSINSITDSTKKLDNTMTKAEKSVKQATKSLMGFDEINKLTKSGTSSNGSTGVDLDVPTLNVTGGLDAGLNKQVSDAKAMVNKALGELSKAWSTGDFSGIGAKLSRKMDLGLRSINWDKIKATAAKLGKSIATFINGVFSDPNLFYDLGNTLAQALNTALMFGFTLGSTLDFASIGDSIAQEVNGFFENFDFAMLGATISAWVDGIWDMLYHAVKNIKWGEVFNGISETLDHMTLKTKVILSAAIIWKIGSKLITAKLVGEVAKKALTKALKSAFAQKVSVALGSLAMKFTGVGVILTGITTALASFVSIWKDGFTVIKTVVMGVGIALGAVGAIILGAPALLAGIVAAIVAAIALVVLAIKRNWKAVVKFLKAAWKVIWSFLVTVDQTIDKIVLAIVNTIITVLKTAKNVIVTILKGIWKVMLAIFDVIGTTLSTGVRSTIMGVIGYIRGVKKSLSGVIDFITGVFSGNWKKAWKGVVEIFSGIWESITSVAKAPVNAIIDMVNYVIKALNKIKFKAPKGIPGIGGKSWGINISQVPHLANGGYVRANTPQLAMIGDNRTDGEIVSPTKKMYDTFMKAIDSYFGGNNGGGDTNITIPIYLDGNKLDERIVKAQKRHAMRTGGR